MKYKFRKDESVQAILYILHKLNGSTDMHKVYKILYFADQLHLSRYARCITGDFYVAMKYGPVPSIICDIFKAVRGDSYFNGDEFKPFFIFQNKYMIKSLNAPDMDYLSESDVECLNWAIEHCKDKSFDELTSMSHGIAYSSTSPHREMSYKDILREVGDDEEYVEYVHQKMLMESEVFA